MIATSKPYHFIYPLVCHVRRCLPHTGTKSGDDHKRVQLVPQYSPSLPGLPSPGYQALKVHQQNTDTVTKRRLTYASTGVTSSKSPSGRIQVINPKKGVDRAQNQKGGAKGSILNKKEIIPKHHHKDTNPHSKADIDFVIEKQKYLLQIFVYIKLIL